MALDHIEPYRLPAIDIRTSGYSALVATDTLSIPEDGGTKGGCGLCLHAGHDVLVDGHGERDAAVAQSLADHLGVDSLLQQDAGVGVAKVVETYAGHVELGDGAPERLADVVRVDGRAVGLGEHVAVVAASPGGHALFELVPAVAAQFRDGEGIEVDGSPARGGLEAALDEVVAHRQVQWP